MSRKVSTILISVALVALLLMISLTNGILHPASAPKIVEVKTVLILSDKTTGVLPEADSYQRIKYALKRIK
jgi:hypothetical protein